MSQVFKFDDDGVVGEWQVDPGDKKYKVVLYANQQDWEKGIKWKTVRFGAKGYQQYQDNTPLKAYSSEDHLDETRRASYRARQGAQGYQDVKYSPAWFAWNFLW